MWYSLQIVYKFCSFGVFYAVIVFVLFVCLFLLFFCYCFFILFVMNYSTRVEKDGLHYFALHDVTLIPTLPISQIIISVKLGNAFCP